MAGRANKRRVRGYRRSTARQAASERVQLLSFLQVASWSLAGGSYTLDPTSRTILIHPGTFPQAQDESLATYLQLLLDATDEGIYGLDLAGCCTFSNRAAAALLGYQPAELLGQNMHQLIHHSYGDGTAYPESECPIFRAFQNGQGIRVDDEVLWRWDGTPFPAEYSSYPIMEQGQIIGAVVTFRDITQRKEAEAALRESEERKTAILDAALDAIITMDQHGCVVEFNPAAERLFGYQREAVLGQELAGLIISPSASGAASPGACCPFARGSRSPDRQTR